MMSETGVVDIPDANIVEKGRLGPGQVDAPPPPLPLLPSPPLPPILPPPSPLLPPPSPPSALTLGPPHHPSGDDDRPRDGQVPPVARGEAGPRLAGAVRRVAEEAALARRAYPFDAEAGATQGDVENQRDVTQMTAFGWSLEDLEMQVSDMSNGGKETLFDGERHRARRPLREPQPLYDYFKQRFAQVTNPPIDPLREGIVMGVEMTLGKRRDLLAAPAEALAEFLTLDSPVLNAAGARRDPRPPQHRDGVDALPDRRGPRRAEGGGEGAVRRGRAPRPRRRRGPRALRLPRRRRPGGDAFIPPLLATGAVHHHLIRAGLRLDASIVVETAQPRSTHHIACLVGFGASAVHPYQLWNSVRYLYESPKAKNQREKGSSPRSRSATRTSTREGARGRRAQDPLEDRDLALVFVPRRPNLRGDRAERRARLHRLRRHAVADRRPHVLRPRRGGGASGQTAAFGAEAAPERLRNYGFVKFYQRLEYHENTPPMSRQLHEALRDRVSKGETEGWLKYEEPQGARSTKPVAIRNLLEIKSDRSPIDIEKVEPSRRS